MKGTIRRNVFLTVVLGLVSIASNSTEYFESESTCASAPKIRSDKGSFTYQLPADVKLEDFLSFSDDHLTTRFRMGDPSSIKTNLEKTDLLTFHVLEIFLRSLNSTTKRVIKTAKFQPGSCKTLGDQLTSGGCQRITMNYWNDENDKKTNLKLNYVLKKRYSSADGLLDQLSFEIQTDYSWVQSVYLSNLSTCKKANKIAPLMTVVRITRTSRGDFAVTVDVKFKHSVMTAVGKSFARELKEITQREIIPNIIVKSFQMNN